MRASMFVIDKTGDYVVIIKRYKDGREYYVVPGGKVVVGESVQHAAIREISEELDLNINESDIIGSLNGDDNVFFFAKTGYKQGGLSIHGEEKSRSNLDNVYQPIWIRISEIFRLEIFPKFDKNRFSKIVGDKCNE